MARILVLEDDSRMRSALAVMLESLGHDPVEADCCSDAEAQQVAAPCELILVDLDVDQGRDGVRRLLDAYPDVPILVTDSGSSENLGSAFGSQVFTVNNPFDLGQLFDSVEGALDAADS